MPSVLLDLETVPAIWKGSEFRAWWIDIIKLSISIIYCLFACLFSQKLKAKLWSMSVFWLEWYYSICTVGVLLDQASGKGSLIKTGKCKEKKDRWGWYFSRSFAEICRLMSYLFSSAQSWLFHNITESQEFTFHAYLVNVIRMWIVWERFTDSHLGKNMRVLSDLWIFIRYSNCLQLSIDPCNRQLAFYQQRPKKMP